MEDTPLSPVEHPHNSRRSIPERLPAAVLKELSALEPKKALIATAEEWISMAAAIALCVYLWHPMLYLIAVMFIGARQHALMVLGHDASHYRYLPKRWQNDLFANLFLMWPVFVSVEGFRQFHGTHHQFTNLERDGNRRLWRTHDAEGNLVPGWVYPKTWLGLALVLLRRALGFTGLFWIIRGLVGAFVIPSPRWMLAARLALYLLVAWALTFFGAWWGFVYYWLVPFCTWHIVTQYARLICEHSAVVSDDEEYRLTRTTIPTLLESIFILPRHIGYHIEHHWYPGVPFYRLPELHQHLMARDGFQAHANLKRSLLASLGECIKPRSRWGRGLERQA
jgi:fatty acid desaturase